MARWPQNGSQNVLVKDYGWEQELGPETMPIRRALSRSLGYPEDRPEIILLRPICGQNTFYV